LILFNTLSQQIYQRYPQALIRLRNWDYDSLDAIIRGEVDILSRIWLPICIQSARSCSMLLINGVGASPSGVLTRPEVRAGGRITAADDPVQHPLPTNLSTLSTSADLQSARSCSMLLINGVGASPSGVLTNSGSSNQVRNMPSGLKFELAAESPLLMILFNTLSQQIYQRYPQGSCSMLLINGVGASPSGVLTNSGSSNQVRNLANDLILVVSPARATQYDEEIPVESRS
jgi:hypothetical protein